MIKLKPKLKFWASAYILTTILFTFIYWGTYATGPDTFIVNRELNLKPITSANEFLWGDPAVAGIDQPARSLDQLQNELRERLEEVDLIENELGSLAEERFEVEQSREAALRKHSDTMWDNAEEYEARLQIKPTENLARAEAELRILEEQQRNLEDQASASQLLVSIANKNVEVTQLRLDRAKSAYKISTYVSDNIRKFADAELSSRVLELDREYWQIYSQEMELSERLRAIRGTMQDTLAEWIKERSKALGLFDFLYYSIGISTTTTFGDIIANSSFARLLVSLQLLMSVFILGGFIDSALQTE